MTLEKAIMNRLLSTQSVTSLVVPKSIYAGILPQSAKLPAIMFITQSIPDKERTLDGCGFPTAILKVFCWGQSYTSSRQICEAVRSSMEQARGLMSSVKVLSVFTESEQDLYDEQGESFGRCVDLLIKYVEPE
jgi:hypothetical protein